MIFFIVGFEYQTQPRETMADYTKLLEILSQEKIKCINNLGNNSTPRGYGPRGLGMPPGDYTSYWKKEIENLNAREKIIRENMNEDKTPITRSYDDRISNLEKKVKELEENSLQ